MRRAMASSLGKMPGTSVAVNLDVEAPDRVAWFLGRLAFRTSILPENCRSPPQSRPPATALLEDTTRGHDLADIVVGPTLSSRHLAASSSYRSRLLRSHNRIR